MAVDYSMFKTDLDITGFMEKLCGYSLTSGVWVTLWKAGGAHRFTDILKHMCISRSCLSGSLKELRSIGLVVMRGRKYQAMSPTWLNVSKTLQAA